MRIAPGVGAPLAALAARSLASTWSWRLLRTSGEHPETRLGERSEAPVVVRPPRPLRSAVYALWHEQILPLAMLHRGSGAMALVSRHRDGEILARILLGLGYRVARGSSTRGGAAGLARMIRTGRAGHPLAVTPDGPRGPRRRCKPGVILAAAETGRPVVPLAAAATRARRLPSWDRFLVPAPFSRIVVCEESPLRVPPALSGAWRDGRLVEEARVRAWTDRVTRALDRASQRCERALG